MQLSPRRLELISWVDFVPKLNQTLLILKLTNAFFLNLNEIKFASWHDAWGTSLWRGSVWFQLAIPNDTLSFQVGHMGCMPKHTVSMWWAEMRTGWKDTKWLIRSNQQVSKGVCAIVPIHHVFYSKCKYWNRTFWICSVWKESMRLFTSVWKSKIYRKS